MKNKGNTGEQMASEPARRSAMLAKIRNRTEQELEASLAHVSPTYSAAALGQAPYVAVGNGIVIVQRRCHNWNC